jgi:hypothetical protein
MSRPFGSVRRFVPRLDCLDDRALPSATVTAIDGVVVVRGDSSGNTIRVFDNGTRDVGNVVVEVDGQRLDFDTPVDEVRINGGGGGDSVRYDLTTDLNSDRLVTVNLGNGRDSFTAEMRGDVGEDVDLEVRVNGGNGQDNIRLLAADVTTRAGATMAVDFAGGNGRDDLGVDYSGVVTGRTDFTVDGGNGSDRLTGVVVVDPTSGGELDARWFGGNGADSGEVSGEGIDRLTMGNSVVDGERGQDTITVRGDVEAV